MNDGPSDVLKTSEKSDDAAVVDKAQQEQALKQKLVEMKSKHRLIDTQITALTEMGSTDMLKIGRLKKQKLLLKDKIVIIEDQITPDIIA